MQFTKFSSLTNTYDAKTLQQCVNQNIRGPWVVTEKVDGANFGFYTDGITVQFASRNQFVDGTFFACQPVLDEMAPKVLDLYHRAGMTGVTIVFGELYGPNINGRINYGEKGFVAFDLHNYSADPEDNDNVCPKDIAFNIFCAVGIPVTPVLGYFDTLDEALKVSNSFRSLLTPDDHEGDNFAEGTVIEPADAQWFGNGARVYLKNKSQEFNEISGVKHRKAAAPIVLPGEVQAVVEGVSQYLNENRVHSYVSKTASGDFGEVLRESLADALQDWEKDAGKTFKDAVGFSEGLVRKELLKTLTPHVRKVLFG